MRHTTNLSATEANDILSNLLSVNHGWWCDFIEEYSDARGRRRQRLKNRPYYSPAFLAMYGYSQEEMSLMAIIREELQPVVIREMKAAMKPGSAGRSGTMPARTKTGEEKLVEVYLRRIDRPDGTALLASIHSDLTISTDVQWIERTVLQRLQAFVFVKRWDPNRRLFVFTHMNKKLADELELTSPEHAIGLSDIEFFDDEPQRRAFLEADVAIRDTDNPDLVIVQEEALTPRRRDPAAGPRDIRLLTFKTPFWLPSSGPRTTGWDVLGIAVNVTSVTDVLRAIADKSESGLYIKDEKGRYQYVNKKFLEILGARHERQVMHRTFAETLQVLTDSGNVPSAVDFGVLEALIQEEDELVLAGTSKVAVRTVSFRDGSEWLTEKHPIRSQNGLVTHLMGITSPLFPGRLGEILDKLPQCIAVKKFHEAERGQPGEFKLVWGNSSFLNIHGRGALAQLIGKSDYDLWPKEQADQFRKRDRMVVDIYRELQANTGWDEMSPRDRWTQVVATLRTRGCWEFRETQRRDEWTHVLQTTKWVEAIEGANTLFVVVVYSDVTKGDAEQQRYHEMTVHNIRGATAPNDVAMMHLKRYLEERHDADAAVQEAIACLEDAYDNVDQFLEHHLNLLRMNIQCRPTEILELFSQLRHEAAKAGRRWRVPVTVDDTGVRADTCVSCDPAFMRFVLAELLLNAIKATYRRAKAAKACGNKYSPSVVVRFSEALERMQCIISDNGAACSDADERAGLVRSFQQATENPFESYIVSLGLSFCAVAVQAQKGKISFASSALSTDIEVHFPILPKASDT